LPESASTTGPEAVDGINHVVQAGEDLLRRRCKGSDRFGLGFRVLLGEGIDENAVQAFVAVRALPFDRQVLFNPIADGVLP
jgi:hypothetical protein